MGWTTPRDWTTGETPDGGIFNTHVRDNLSFLYSDKASLAGAAFSGPVSTSSTLGVTGATTLSTASLSGALTLAVETILTGLSVAPSAPASGKGALYLDNSLIPKVRTNSTTYTIPYLETANTFAAAQTLNGAGSNLILNAPAGNNEDIMFQSGGVNAIIARKTNDARTGSDAGDNFGINTRTDAGASKAWPLYIERSSGNVMINGTAPTAQLDVNGNTIRLRTQRTPASASASGNAGDICADSNYIYYCTATNTWKRAAIATW